MLLGPDDFAGRPYGYLTNQISHGYVGMFAMSFYSWAVYHLTADYPDQTISGLVLIAAYFMLWEVGYQRWRGMDTLEDTYFVAMGVVPWFAIDMSQIIDKLFLWQILVIVSLSIGTAKRWHDAGTD